MERYKARLVARGCAQREGIDFSDTFSPVVNFAVIRLMFAICVIYRGWAHRLIDVTNAYLYGDLNAELYMRQPADFSIQGKKDYVCKLRKSIYGLRQSDHEWYRKIDAILRDLGFTKMLWCNCAYKYKNVGIVLIYVDDMPIFGRNNAAVRSLN